MAFRIGIPLSARMKFHCMCIIAQYPIHATFPLFSQRLWRGETVEVIGPVRVVHQYVNMPEQSAEFYNQTTGKSEEVNPLCLSVILRE